VSTTPPNQEPTTEELIKHMREGWGCGVDGTISIAADRLDRQQKVIDELEEEIKKPQSWSGVTLPKQVVVQMYDRDIRLLGIISKLKGAQDD